MKVVFRLKGGLGNQLFIVSYGIISKQLLKIEPSYDLTLYKKKYKNSSFTIRRLDISQLLRDRIKEWSPSFGPFRFESNYSKTIIKYLNFKYYSNEEELENIRGQKIYLDNYYQNSTKILEYRELILSELSLNEFESSNKNFNQYLRNIKNEKSLSIHIRRGDYLKDENQKIFHALKVKYFLNAYNYLIKEDNSIKPFIFSDDISFCKENLKIKNAIYIENTSSIEDFILMTNCSYHIISNSTFSWWSAFLSKSSKKVIIPNKWYSIGRPEQIIFPENWIKFKS